MTGVRIGRYVGEFPARFTLLLDGRPPKKAKAYRDIFAMNFDCPEERAQQQCFDRGREAKLLQQLSKPKN
jgi:hypothetical protein